MEVRIDADHGWRHRHGGDMAVERGVGGRQAAPAQNAGQNQMLAENVFKNVTRSAVFPSTSSWEPWASSPRRWAFLRGLPHRFIERLGQLRKGREPRKAMARQMVAMMAGINSYFGGRQVVTCFVPSRQQPAEGHGKLVRALWRAASRRARRAHHARRTGRPDGGADSR
jgi:hypothetical protein